MKTRLKGIVMKDGKVRLWTGLPLGVAVTYAATKVMPDFAIESNYLYAAPYCAPAAIVGALMLLSPKTRQAGYGTLLGALGYYVYATGYNLATGEKVTDYQAPDGSMPPYVSEVKGAPVQILG